MPSPGVKMPTMRSPGTAPPLGAKRTGRSPRSRGSAMACGVAAGARHLELHALRPSAAEPARIGAARPLRRLALFLEVGIDGLDHIAGKDFAAPDRRQHVVDRRRARGAAARLSACRRRKAWPARSKARTTIWRPSPAYCARTASRVARRIAARALPVTAMRFPRRRRHLALGAHDLDLVAVVQCGASNGATRPLILAPTAELPTLGVHRIGEIDRRRAARQRDQARPWA